LCHSAAFQLLKQEEEKVNLPLVHALGKKKKEMFLKYVLSEKNNEMIIA